MSRLAIAALLASCWTDAVRVVERVRTVTVYDAVPCLADPPPVAPPRVDCSSLSVEECGYAFDEMVADYAADLVAWAEDAWSRCSTQ